MFCILSCSLELLMLEGLTLVSWTLKDGESQLLTDAKDEKGKYESNAFY